MAKLLTFTAACARFGGLVVSNFTIEEAVQEAVDRTFELGRWPGTTQEMDVAEEDFVINSDTNEWFISFDEQEYAGALGFRNGSRGWSIVDKTMLYKDGINAGDREFVDYGTVQVDGERLRKYRAPLGFSPDSGPYYALMKKEAPVLTGDDLVPIEGIGPLKCAVQAVNYEFTGDDERAQTKWAEMLSYMLTAQRQNEGVKRYSMGLDSSLNRHPRQFK